jgi:hypothetical protein
MAEGIGINKESVTRIVKSKWFFPALGVGGIGVVLLIVMNKRAGGGSSAATADEYPGDVYDPETNAPIGSEADLSGLEKYLSDLFGDYAGSQQVNSQAQQDAINKYLEGQTKANQDYLDQVARSVQSQIDSGLQQIDSGLSGMYGQTPYVDPYAGIYGDSSNQITAPVDSFYGMDTPYSPVPVNEGSTIVTNPLPQPEIKIGSGTNDDRGLPRPETKVGAGADVKGTPANIPGAKDNKAGYSAPIVTGKDYTPTPGKAPNILPAQTAPKYTPPPTQPSKPAPLPPPKYTPPKQPSKPAPLPPPKYTPPKQPSKPAKAPAKVKK